MTTFRQVCARCKTRHDFGDRIQARYRHPAGEQYDTWVSVEEMTQRLRNDAFRDKRLELARVNLRGPFPAQEPDDEQNDWI